MSVQFVINAKGEKTSVLISYKEWNALKAERDELIHKLEEAELSLRYKQHSKGQHYLNRGNLKPTL